MDPSPSLVTTSIGRLATRWHAGDPGRLPVVLGHGIYLDSHVWDRVVATLGDHPVLTVDGPAHGGSGPPPAGWSLDLHADALVEVLDHYGLDRPVLAGHSWGGMVALQAALTHPHRVAGLGLVNTPLTRVTRGSWLFFTAQRGMLRVAGLRGFYARRTASALYARSSLHRQPALADRMVGRLAGRSGADLAGTVRAVVLDPASQLPRLPELRMPVTVLAGREDYVLPAATRTAVERSVRDLSVVVADGGHVSPEEDPGTVGAALRELLRRARHAGGGV